MGVGEATLQDNQPTESSHDTNNTLTPKDHTTPTVSTHHSGTPSATTMIHSLERRRAQRRRDCLRTACACSCHRTAEISGRFWMLKYTPLAAFQNPCDSPLCTGSKSGMNLRVALSKYGLRWAAILQFQIQTTAGRVSLHPTLEVERIVPDGSFGFGLVQMHTRGEISFNELMDGFSVLAREDPTFRRHVNPAGENYLEVSVPPSHWY